VKRGQLVLTTRRWAWKQPSFKDSVTAHWSMPFGAENVTGLKLFTEAKAAFDKILMQGSRTFCNFFEGDLKETLKISEAIMLA